MKSSDRDETVFGKVLQAKIARARSLRQQMSLPEVLLWQRLRPKVNKSFRLRRQVPLLGKFTVDFYYEKLKIVFEIDGKSHEGMVEIDALRDRLLSEAGIAVVRISARSVLANADEVAEFIRKICMGEIAVQDIE